MTRLRKTTEKQFQGQVEKLAKMLGWTYYHTWNSIHSTPGFPDLVLVRVKDGQGCRVIFAELKSETGKLTDAQAEWLKLLEMSSNEVYVWRADCQECWDEIQKVLQ